MANDSYTLLLLGTVGTIGLQLSRPSIYKIYAFLCAFALQSAALEAFYHKALLLAQGELEHLGVEMGCDGLLWNLKALTCSVLFCLSTHTVAC